MTRKRRRLVFLHQPAALETVDKVDSLLRDTKRFVLRFAPQSLFGFP